MQDIKPRRDYHSTMNAVIPVRAVKRSEFIVDGAFDLMDMGNRSKRLHLSSDWLGGEESVVDRVKVRSAAGDLSQADFEFDPSLTPLAY